MLHPFHLRGVDWENDTIKCALLSSSHVPDTDTQIFWDDVSANEISGTGYTAGGATVANASRSYDSATKKTTLDCDDPEWTGATFSATWAVFYKDTGTPGTSVLVKTAQITGDTSVSSGKYTLQVPGSGVLTMRNG
jgi:hypothetical protein